LPRHSILVIWQTFEQLAHSAVIDPTNSALLISQPSDISPTPVEISTVYFRAGYTPKDYPTPSHYQTRFLLERSRAIKCPSIALQLAGGKKLQEVLTHPGILEKFLCDETKNGKAVFSKTQLEEMRGSWVGMWGLDYAEQGNPDAGVQKARSLANSLVLKPQREGGGNNIYKGDILPFLDQLPPRERQAWIAMELIVPPSGTSNYLVRSGGGVENTVRTEVISELGIFGWSLFGGSDLEVKEKEVGWLVRTKGIDSNEGGVAAGFSVLDSIVLLDE
jgi:glutathione synthase